MSLRLLTAGESHGPALTAILDGIPAGLTLDAGWIDQELSRRQQGFGAGPRMKIEKDNVHILAGVMDGLTTGAPIALQIINSDHANWKGKAVKQMTNPRPGHADLSGAMKYGYRDLRPALERASARETAARVAAGAVCKRLLEEFGIHVGGYVVAIGSVSANLGTMPYQQRFISSEASRVRCPDPKAAEKMHAEIEEIIRLKDTLGGIVEVVALNVPPGLGSYVQWDRRLDVRLAAAAMSVQAMKGVEIGDAFDNARLTGTQAHDAIKLEVELTGGKRQTRLVRPTNRAGGIEGGISNGEPIVLRAAMKPIATTLTPLTTVDLAARKEAPTKYERSDFCPVPRAVPVVETMVAYVLADALIEKIGGDSLSEMKPRFESLRQGRLEDLPMDNSEHEWWS
jgi:chorismate synthase